MEAQRRAFHTFLSPRAAKARPTEEPVAHLQFCGPCGELAPVGAPRTDELLQERRDAERERERERVVALVFDRRTVLSEVLYDPSELARAGAAGA